MSLSTIRSSQYSEINTNSDINNALEDLSQILPNELLAQIFTHLSTYKALSSVALTCKRWKKLLIQREIVILNSLQSALNSYGGKRTFSIDTSPIINLQEDSSLHEIRKAVADQTKRVFLTALIDPKKGELEDSELKALDDKTNGLMPNGWTHIFSIVKFTYQLQLINNNSKKFNRGLKSLFSDLLKKDPAGAAMAVQLLAEDKKKLFFQLVDFELDNLLFFFNPLLDNHDVVGVSAWAQLIPYTSARREKIFERISLRLISQGYSKDALEVAQLIPENSDDGDHGIWSLRDISIALIKKGFIKDALQVAKLITNDSDARSMALEDISIKLIKKGFIEDALEVAKLILENSDDGIDALENIGADLRRKGGANGATLPLQRNNKTTPLKKAALSIEWRYRVTALDWIAKEFIKKGYPKEALEVARSISTNSNDGDHWIWCIRDISIALIEKGFIKDALQVAKLIPENSDDGIDALEKIGAELSGKGWAIGATLPLHRKNKTTPLKKAASNTSPSKSKIALSNDSFGLPFPNSEEPMQGEFVWSPYKPVNFPSPNKIQKEGRTSLLAKVISFGLPSPSSEGSMQDALVQPAKAKGQRPPKQKSTSKPIPNKKVKPQAQTPNKPVKFSSSIEVKKEAIRPLPAKHRRPSTQRSCEITQIALAALAICSIGIAVGVSTFVVRYLSGHLGRQVIGSMMRKLPLAASPA